MSKLKLFYLLSLLLVLNLILDLGYAWTCAYKEFPVETKKIKGPWWIYATSPKSSKYCMLKKLDLYWTRITKTDYINYAVELHCTPPWFRHQAAIYTRKKEPSEAVLKKITDYLTTVQLSLDKFKPQNMSTCKNYSNEPLQVWHRYRYMHLDFNPHFIRPLVKDKDI